MGGSKDSKAGSTVRMLPELTSSPSASPPGSTRLADGKSPSLPPLHLSAALAVGASASPCLSSSSSSNRGSGASSANLSPATNAASRRDSISPLPSPIRAAGAALRLPPLDWHPTIFQWLREEIAQSTAAMPAAPQSTSQVGSPVNWDHADQAETQRLKNIFQH